MRERDRNQPLHVARSRRSPLPMQPVDKQTTSTTAKPFTPTLSSNFRSVKSPLTPRVAGSPSPSPTISTPRQPFVRSKSPAKAEQPTTPLAGNITPRSAARKSRNGTESPLTPAQPRVLPNGQRSRASSGAGAQKRGVGQTPGLGITSPRLAASQPVLTIHRRVSASKSLVDGSKDVSSKFFHADEAKSAIGFSGEESHRSPPKPGHFFIGSPAPLTTTDIAVERSESEEKFFRACDITANTATKWPVLPHLPIDKINNLNSPNPEKDYCDTPPQSPKKSSSPVVPYPASPRKYQPGQTPSPTAARAIAERPRSIGSITGLFESSSHSHRKSLSASSILSIPVRKASDPLTQTVQASESRNIPTFSPRAAGSNVLSPETLSPRSTSLTSTTTMPTSVASDPGSTLNVTSTLTISEPKAEQTPTQNLAQDRASNARRERKVLDLEISNSSLLAINKTLERELRKQSTELRRYRRLSRSGRLSIAPSARTISEQSNFSLNTVTELDDEDRHPSDLDEDSDFDDLDDENSSLLSTESGSITSPSARSRQRARDEKRLLEDLSRHQQLLLDSQKLSQSIRRCLTCTDELIREGNKALDYRVGIGDVKLGGRVLNGEELDELGLANGVLPEQEARQGLLSPSVAKANLDHAQLWADALAPMTSGQGKDVPGLPSLDELTDLLESVSAEMGTFR